MQDNRSTVELVAESIRDGIRSGRYMAGQRLVEADITSELAVSRGPVREAMRRLSAEGLVEIAHHQGARIKRLSRSDVLSLYEIRELLEGLAARLAAEQISSSKGLTTKVRGLKRDMQRASKRADIERYVQLNREFHDLLVTHSGNPHLPAMIANLQTQVMRFQFRSLLDHKAILQSEKDHKAIVDAVLRADADGAEKLMRAHVRRSRDLVLRLPEALFAPEQANT